MRRRTGRTTSTTRLTALAATDEAGDVGEVTSPDDNLQAVFAYLVEE